MNLTGNHEVVGSIPGLTQLVGDLASLCAVASSCSLGTSYAEGAALKKRKKKKNKKTKKKKKVYTIAIIWEQPKCPSTDEWIRIWHCHKLWCRLQKWLGSRIAVALA